MGDRQTSLDRSWEKAFVVECRVRDYTGKSIGDALAQVESHCLATGEDVNQAFGDPVAYATSLDLPKTRGSIRAIAASGLLGLISLFLIPGAIAGIVRESPLFLTTGQIIVYAIVLAATLALGVLPRPTLRTLLSLNRGQSIVIGTLVVGLWIGIMLLAPAPVELPAGWSVAIGGVCLAAAVAIGWRALGPDPVSLPDPNPGHGLGTRIGLALIWPAVVGAFTLLNIFI